MRADNTNLLVRLLGRAASLRPRMVVLEDAHWFDSASWSLVLQARRRVDSAAARADDAVALDRSADPLGTLRGEATTLHLTPLSADDAISLVMERTGAARVTEPVAALVRERAEGNPLSSSSSPMPCGTPADRRHSGEVRVAPGVGDLETSITHYRPTRDYVTARRLPPGEAMTAKVASVIGQRFALRTLAEIYPSDRARDPGGPSRHAEPSGIGRASPDSE